VSKLGLRIAPIPEEIKDPVAPVILLINEDLICSESSALTVKENPSDIVKIELSKTLDTLLLDNFIKEIPIIKRGYYISRDIYI
jgi:hypothetical protein